MLAHCKRAAFGGDHPHAWYCRQDGAQGRGGRNSGCGVKVIYPDFQDNELDPANISRGPKARQGGPLRVTPLTGALLSDPSGGLIVRRVRVRVVVGPDRGREALLEAGTLLVGTHPDNDLVLRDPSVGKYHLEVALVAGGVRIRDLGSDGGTFVSSVRSSIAVLPIGTEILVGRSTLQLLPGDVLVPVPPSERTSFGPVLGGSPAMRQLFALLERVAPSDTPILLEGEPGTGRTLTAKAIHASSRFAASPITVVDFGLPLSDRPPLGSISQRSDTFTLLLERIDEVPPSDFGPLLALYERHEEGVLDARILATASSELRRGPDNDRLRRDLMTHASAVHFHIPPLRARAEDIPMLVRQFSLEACGVDPKITAEESGRMLAWDYPGNVRELRQIVVRALKTESTATVLPPAGAARGRAALVLPLNTRPKPPLPKVAHDLLLGAFERAWLAGIYARHRGSLADVSRETGLGRRDLVRALKRCGIGDPR